MFNKQYGTVEWNRLSDLDEIILAITIESYNKSLISVDERKISWSLSRHDKEGVRFEVFTAVTVKNAVFWDIKTQFVLHKRHITPPLQSPAS
jgi:hypothetical protein